MTRTWRPHGYWHKSREHKTTATFWKYNTVTYRV